MHYHLPAIESPAAGTRRILSNLLEDIGDMLATPSAASDTNIHEMRKTCKKLRALLVMLRPAIAADVLRALDRNIRDLARQLGGLRDNKVILDTLDAVGQHFASLLRAETLAPVHEALSEAMRRDNGTPGAALDIAALQALLAEIMAMARDLDYGQISRQTLLAGIANCYRRGRRALARMEASPVTEHGHALRRQAKYQYYQLQLLEPWNDTVLKPLASGFHRLEETLGRDHDLALLESMLARRPQLCQGRVRRELLFALIESRRITLMSHALRLARELYHAKPGRYLRRLETAFTPAA